MEIRIIFEAENASFVDDFDDEIERILDQAEGFIRGQRDTDKLVASNGNIVGTVWRSTTRRP